MATTSKGFSYPLPADPVGGLAALLLTLANKLNAAVGEFASGEEVVTVNAANQAFSKVINFPAGRFTNAPTVSATYQGTSPGQMQGPTISAVSVNGFTVHVYRTSGTANLTVHWIARN